MILERFACTLIILSGMLSAWLGRLSATSRLQGTERTRRRFAEWLQPMPEGRAWFLQAFWWAGLGRQWLLAGASWLGWTVLGVMLIGLGFGLLFHA